MIKNDKMDKSKTESNYDQRIGFELFKSNVCHKVKRLGDIDFIIEMLEQDSIYDCFNKEWYPEALYLLAMLDYISRINNVTICTRYDELRKCKLQDVLYPTGILIFSAVTKNEKYKTDAYKESIPEFIRFNIVENEVRNVI